VLVVVHPRGGGPVSAACDWLYGPALVVRLVGVLGRDLAVYSVSTRRRSGHAILSPVAESFAMVPWRITEALIRDELSRDEYVTLNYLVAKISREPSLVLVTELAVVKAETNAKVGRERLRQVLDGLEAKTGRSPAASAAGLLRPKLRRHWSD
jgi:hypothetical protein